MTNPWKSTAFFGGVSAAMMIAADAFRAATTIAPGDSGEAIRWLSLACNLIAGLCMGAFLYRATMLVARGRRDGRVSPALACRDPDGDIIEFFASDESYHGKWIDPRLTAYIGSESGRIVGCEIGGVSAIEGGGSNND